MTKNASVTTGGPAWFVTFLNNAGDLPLLVADSTAVWGGVTVVVEEDRAGTSSTLSGSFDVGISGDTSDMVTVSHDSSADEVSQTYRRNTNRKHPFESRAKEDCRSLSCRPPLTECDPS